MMNLPILSTVQQQLTAVFEQWLTMMREALSVTSRKSVEPTSHPPWGDRGGPSVCLFPMWSEPCVPSIT